MMRYSICYITGQLGLGGAERQLYLLVRELARRGHQVTVLTFNAGCDDYWEAPLKALGINLVAIPAGTNRLRRFSIVCRALRAVRADVVHSWTFSANLYAALCGRFSLVRLRLGSERSNHICSQADLGAIWYRASLLGLDGIVTNSQAAGAYLQAFRPELQVHVVPNGVETPQTVPLPLEVRARIRANFGVPLDAVVVVGVGTHVPRKNFQQLIEAVARLVPRHSEMILVLIGDGPLRSELESQAESLLLRDRVLFLGSVKNADALLGAFDILCLPSLAMEGMPNVLMEAAAAGVPVVASAVCGVGEIVENHRTGILFPERDVDALTAALSLLLVDKQLRQNLGRAAHECIRRKYSVTSMADAIEQLYAFAHS